MIKKYVKKPIPIEAIQWTGDNAEKVKEFVGDLLSYKVKDYIDIAESDTSIVDGYFFVIKTLEGNMRVGVGDYIIKGIKGEFYPCKEDIFLETYEEVFQGYKDPYTDSNPFDHVSSGFCTTGKHIFIQTGTNTNDEMIEGLPCSCGQTKWEKK